MNTKFWMIINEKDQPISMYQNSQMLIFLKRQDARNHVMRWKMFNKEKDKTRRVVKAFICRI